MPGYLENSATKTSEAIQAKTTIEIDPKNINLDTKQVETPVGKDKTIFYDFLSDHSDNEAHSGDEEFFDTVADPKYKIDDLNDPSNTVNKGSIENIDATMGQNANTESLEKLGCLNITFRKGNNYKQWEVANIVNEIKTDSEKTKIVKLSFQSCRYIDDFDLVHLGNGIGSKLGNVEYLNLSFWSSRRVTILGIQELIRIISGQRNTLKSLRLRIRGHWYLGNQSLKDMIKGIRASLVNLEELHVILSGNLWVTCSGVKAVKDDERVIEGLGMGLKKYEVSDNWCVVSLFKDGASKDMSKYVMEKFKEMNAKEGALVSNNMFVYYQRVWKSSVVSTKVALSEVNKSA